MTMSGNTMLSPVQTIELCALPIDMPPDCRSILFLQTAYAFVLHSGIEPIKALTSVMSECK